MHCTVYCIVCVCVCVNAWTHVCNGEEGVVGEGINSLQKCHAMMLMVGAESNEGIDLHSAVSA